MLPNLLIIGAQKCGTTSLHAYLDQHADIHMSVEKEPHFFSRRDRDLEEYTSLFPDGFRYRGESSTSYTQHPLYPDVPRRISRVLGPEVRFFYVLRDPIDRVVSTYVHHHAVGRYDGTIREVLTNREMLRIYNFLDTSRYATQLERYLEYFPLSQVKILTLERLRSDPIDTMAEAFAFLGLSPPEDADFSEIHQKSTAKRRLSSIGRWVTRMPGKTFVARTLPAAVKDRLRDLYAPREAKPELPADLRASLEDELGPDVERLRVLTGLPLEDWSL